MHFSSWCRRTAITPVMVLVLASLVPLRSEGKSCWYEIADSPKVVCRGTGTEECLELPVKHCDPGCEVSQAGWAGGLHCIEDNRGGKWDFLWQWKYSCDGGCPQWEQKIGTIKIIGGVIEDKWKCKEDGSDCQSFNCGDVICWDHRKVTFVATPRDQAGEPALYEWEVQHEVLQVDECPNLTTEWSEPPSRIGIGADGTNRIYTNLWDPGHYRLRLHAGDWDALIGWVDCYSDYCDFWVIKSWISTARDDPDEIGHLITVNAECQPALNENGAFEVSVQPWWLDEGEATMTLSPYQNVNLYYRDEDTGEFQQIDLDQISGSITWAPPHCSTTVPGTEIPSIEIPPVADRDPSGAIKPVKFYLQGIHGGEVTITLDVTVGGGTCTETAKVLVVEADIDYASAYDDESQDEGPNWLPFNDDDDNTNLQWDYEEGSSCQESGEVIPQDLWPIYLAAAPVGGGYDGTVTLTWEPPSYDSPRVRVWADASKSEEIVFQEDPPGSGTWKAPSWQASQMPSVLYLEGIAAGSLFGEPGTGPVIVARTDFSLSYACEYEPGTSKADTDCLPVDIVRFDADVDSDNDGMISEEVGDPTEDEIEDSPQHLGVLVVVNDDDDDCDGQGAGADDRLDGYDADPGDPTDDDNPNEDDLQQLWLRIDQGLVDGQTLADVHIKIEVEGGAQAPPGQTQGGQFRLWLGDKDNGFTLPNPRDPKPVKQGGDWLEAGIYRGDELGFGTSESDHAINQITIYIEGINPSDTLAEPRLLFYLDPNKYDSAPPTYEWIHVDAVRFTVVKCDLDIDSDNDDGKNLPEQNAEEEQIEEDPPGKIMCFNNDDDDNNGTSDLDDPTEVADQDKNDLIPFVVKVARTAEAWRLNAIYTGSGRVKVWKERTKGAGQEIILGEWQTMEGGSVYEVLYVEGTAVSSASGDVQLVLQADVDGDGEYQATEPEDRVRISVVKFDLDVDTDRDNNIEEDDDEKEEDNWTWGPNGRGAVVLVNCDDDEGSLPGVMGLPDNYVPEDVNGIKDDFRQPEDRIINGTADVEDLGTLRIQPFGIELPPEFQVRMNVTKGYEHVHIFRRRAYDPAHVADRCVIGPTDGSEWALDNPPPPADSTIRTLATTAVDMGIEAIHFPDPNRGFSDGFIEIELILDCDDDPNNGNNLAIDKVKLRASSFVLLPNTQPLQLVYVVDRADNAAFRADLAQHSPLMIPGINASTYGGDRWVQDEIEIGYTQAPYQTIRVVLDLPRDRGLDPYPEKELLGPGYGYYDPVLGGPSDPKDFGGNIEVTPPLGSSHPFGLFLAGSNLDSRLKQFFEAQQVQVPPIYLDVDWLHVGHVDEIVSFVSAGDDPLVLVADSALGWHYLEQIWNDTGENPPLECAPRNTCEQYYLYGLLINVNQREANKTVIPRRMQQNRSLITATIPGVRFHRVPVVFWDREGSLDDSSGCTAITYNLVNSLVHTSLILAPYADQPSQMLPHAWYNPNVDYLFWRFVNGDGSEGIPSLADENPSLAAERIRDFAVYHYWHGEVHCGTNAERAFFSTPWWENMP